MRVELDKFGYFVEEVETGGVEVSSLPKFENEQMQQSCRLVNGTWVFDEECYKQKICGFKMDELANLVFGLIDMLA